MSTPLPSHEEALQTIKRFFDRRPKGTPNRADYVFQPADEAVIYDHPEEAYALAQLMLRLPGVDQRLGISAPEMKGVRDAMRLVGGWDESEAHRAYRMFRDTIMHDGTRKVELSSPDRPAEWNERVDAFATFVITNRAKLVEQIRGSGSDGPQMNEQQMMAIYLYTEADDALYERLRFNPAYKEIKAKVEAMFPEVDQARQYVELVIGRTLCRDRAAGRDIDEGPEL